LVNAAAMSPAGFAQNVIIIKPQLATLEDVCPGQEVLIICETRGSQIIEWASEEYIGRSVEIAFAIVDHVGNVRTSPDPLNSNTIATLLKNEMDDDAVQVLRSELRIIASVNSTVTCGIEGNVMTTSIKIQILGNLIQ
jgi:hypothetical protein